MEQLAEADERGRLLHIRREGSKVNEMPDLFGLDLAGIKQLDQGQRAEEAGVKRA